MLNLKKYVLKLKKKLLTRATEAVFLIRYRKKVFKTKCIVNQCKNKFIFLKFYYRILIGHTLITYCEVLRFDIRKTEINDGR